jgi:hypothetical protein
MAGFPMYRLIGFSADNYLYRVVRLDADWVVSVDEDAFFVEPSRVRELVSYMNDNGFDYCGMPNGGIIHRSFLPMVMNPFFNVFNARKLRAALSNGFVPREVNRERLFRLVKHVSCDVVPSSYRLNFMTTYDDAKPGSGPKFREPYDDFFCWLLEEGFKPLWLAGEYHAAASSPANVLLDHRGREILLHAWEGRNFLRSAAVQRRIFRLYEFVAQTLDVDCKEKISEQFWSDVYRTDDNKFIAV